MGVAEAHAVSAAGINDLPDDVLLERFTSRQQDAAFAALVRRYGPLVLGVCRRVLHHEQDAEDAFQAVFCVLARKAGSIRNRTAVGPWLHAVAYRIARKARAGRGRRPMSTTNLPDIPAVEGSPEWVWRELRPILDEEVSHLPQKHQQVVILCYLEGRTNEQAAAQLGCPLGTVLSRLARARARLRAAFTRRGLTLSATALAAALGSQAAGAMVPPALTRAAIQAAAAFKGGGTPAGAIRPDVSALAHGYLRSLARRRLVRITAGLLAVTAAVVVLVLLFRRTDEPILGPKSDQQLLQGTWSLNRVQMGGQDQPAAGLRLIFAEDKCTLTSPFGQPIVADFQLDANRTPREITLMLRPGARTLGIYRLDGNALTLCINFGGPDRPTEFLSRAGTTVALWELGREK
jgi:RNA polymerase sigma factor (sigma-70 family)